MGRGDRDRLARFAARPVGGPRSSRLSPPVGVTTPGRTGLESPVRAYVLAMTSVTDGVVTTAAAQPDGAVLLEPRPVPWGGVVARARASVALRRLVPAPL